MQRGAEAADFVAAVQPELDRLLRAAVLLCGDRHQAEDLVQSVLVRLLVGGQWRRTDHLYGYLRRCVTNEYLGVRRRRSSTELSVDALDPGQLGVRTDPGPEDRIDLLRALAGLPRLDRAVVVLRFWEDLSVAETATVLGTTPGAVRTRSGRALQRLRAAYHVDPPVDTLTGSGGRPAREEYR